MCGKIIPRVRLYLKILGVRVDGEVDYRGWSDGEERTEGMLEALNRLVMISSKERFITMSPKA